MDMTTLFREDKMIIYLAGEIDHHSAKNIRDCVDKLVISHMPKVLIIDLSGVDFMDSSGLGLVLGRYKKMCEIGGKMYLSGAGDRTKKILKMAGVDKIIRTIEINEGAEV